MAHTDPIADLLTRMRNAISAKHRYVDFIPSKMKLSIVKVLQEQGLIENCLVNEEQRKARAYLKYTGGRIPVINNLKRISSPGIRRYIGHKDIPKIDGGMGVVILTTSKGVVDGETARKLKVGGEVICFIW